MLTVNKQYTRLILEFRQNLSSTLPKCDVFAVKGVFTLVMWQTSVTIFESLQQMKGQISGMLSFRLFSAESEVSSCQLNLTQEQDWLR